MVAVVGMGEDKGDGSENVRVVVRVQAPSPVELAELVPVEQDEGSARNTMEKFESDECFDPSTQQEHNQSPKDLLDVAPGTLEPVSGDDLGESENTAIPEVASSVATSCSREVLTDEVRFGSTYFRRIISEPLLVSTDQNVKDHFRLGAGLVGVLDPSQCPGRLSSGVTDHTQEVRKCKEEFIAAQSISNAINRQPRIGERLRLGNFDTDEDMQFQETHKRQSDAARKEASAYRDLLTQQSLKDLGEAEEDYDGDLAPKHLIIPAPAAGFYAWFGEQPTRDHARADGQEAVTKWWHHSASGQPGRVRRERSDYLEYSRPSSASSRPGSASSSKSSVRVDRGTHVRPHSAASRLSENKSFVSDATASKYSSDSTLNISASRARASSRSVSASRTRRRPASATSVGASGTRNSRVELWRSKERRLTGADERINVGVSLRRTPDSVQTSNRRLLRRGASEWLSTVGDRAGQAATRRPRTAGELYAEHRARKQAAKRGKLRSNKPKGTGQLQMDLEGGGKAGLLTLLSQSTVWQTDTIGSDGKKIHGPN